jgi:hypothetical protein
MNIKLINMSNSNSNNTFNIIVFIAHTIIFALALLFVFINPQLLNNQNYVDILFTLLSTLLIHGGYHIGRSSTK